MIITGVVLMVLALVLGVGGFALGLGSLASTVNGYQRVPAASGGAIELSEPGEYSVYHEVEGAASGASPWFRLTILDPNGTPVAVDRARGSETYTVNETEGRSVAGFTAAKPGTYQVQVATPVAGTLAIGTGGVLSSLGIAFGGMALGAVVGVVGLVLLVVGLVRRPRR